VVLGAGFAGLWSALGAARKLDELGIPGDQVEVVAVNASRYHSIRVRNYEKNLNETLVPLADVLGPTGVNWIEGVVSGIDVKNATLTINTRTATESLEYDRLVFAPGSKLVHPAIPGLKAYRYTEVPASLGRAWAAKKELRCWGGKQGWDCCLHSDFESTRMTSAAPRFPLRHSRVTDD